MAQHISRGIHCVICNKPATYVTEYLWKDIEGYLCSDCNARYINNMAKYLEDSYPSIFYKHERVLKQMKIDHDVTKYGISSINHPSPKETF